MDLYHADIRLPRGFRLPNRTVSLRWTRHATDACNNDRYSILPQVIALDLNQCRIIEVGVEGKRIRKIVVRTDLDDDLDMVFVLIPGPEWTVKTVWANRKNDSHRTLDRNRYVC